MARPKKYFEGNEKREAKAAAKERGEKIYAVNGIVPATGKKGVCFYFVDVTPPRNSMVKSGWTVQEL